MVSKAIKEYRTQDLLIVTPNGLISLKERRRIPRH